MKRRAATRLLLLLSALGGGVVLRARAAEQTCATLSVEADSRLRARHPELPDRVREAFQGRPDVEPCSRISLSFERSLIDVMVALPDGRSAVRSLERSEDVVPTLEALLLVPRVSKSRLDSPEAEPPASPKPKLRRPSPQTALSTGPEFDRGTSPQSGTREPSTFRIELSAALGVRAGDGHAGVGLGLSSLLQISSWFAGFQARAEQYQGSNDRVGLLEVGILTGKRVDLDSVALDLLAGPMFALQGTTRKSDVVAQAPAGDATAEVQRTEIVSESGVETRAFFGTRLSFAPRSMLHAFVALDGDVALSRGEDLSGAGTLPAWTLGLSVGSTVGTP